MVSIGKLEEVEKYHIKKKRRIFPKRFLKFPLSKNVLDAMRKCIETLKDVTKQKLKVINISY